MAKNPDRRISYDRFWGGVLLVSCALPYRLDGESYSWHLFRDGSPAVKAWLIAASIAGLFGVVAGVARWRGRPRHLANLILGGVTLGLPAFAPSIWDTFPETNPAVLPLGELGSVGWVMLAALVAIYAGSGIRIVRPPQIAGQALGALGALLLAVFAFLPMEGDERSLALIHLKLAPAFSDHWRHLVPFCLLALGGLFGTLNLLRSRAEVVLARLTRLLVVAGMLFWVVLPFIDAVRATPDQLALHMPAAWGGLHVIAPLFLTLDGCVAFLAITITRSGE
ncbi:MAG: hypothetical protein ACYTDU_01155 [Planctomycetota bacterium]|jgi:hypothetical protein